MNRLEGVRSMVCLVDTSILLVDDGDDDDVGVGDGDGDDDYDFYSDKSMTNVMSRWEGVHGVFGQYHKAEKTTIVFLIIMMMVRMMKMTVNDVDDDDDDDALACLVNYRLTIIMTEGYNVMVMRMRNPH